MSDTSHKDAVKAVAETIGAYLIGLRVEKLNGDVLRCEVLSFDDKEPPLMENYHSQEITHIHPLHYPEALSQVRKQATDKVPSNWLDPLLTGPEGIGPPPWNCPQIEKLLNGIKSRLLAEE